jgi:NAD(P)H-hydrate epimerase
MKVLDEEQMREVDRRTIELGIPGLILMENAGNRVVDYLVEKFSPLSRQRIVVLCGKGNNGGDGFVVARQLFTRFQPASLHVVLGGSPEELKGDAAENYRMLKASGCDVVDSVSPDMRRATLVIDAVLGTGFTGSPHGRAGELIHEMNHGFPDARIVAVDIPSALAVRAEGTVTFTALKPAHALSPEKMGEIRVVQIGSPASLYQDVWLNLSHPHEFAHLFRPRVTDSNKGMYGHALIIAGGRGKTGAAAMAGVAALRAGAGLSTVASAESAISAIAFYAPEMMTEPLPETADGQIRDVTEGALKRKTIVALGPGLGENPETVQLVRRLVGELDRPMVVDADGLNALAGTNIRPKAPRVFTPHPGEMSRLTGKTIAEIQADRVGVARAYAQEHGVHLVLKGNRTVIAFPDGQVWINPTGSPALATGGTGDVLTGILAGLIAQFPNELEKAVLAGVWLHGRAGELGALKLGEKPLIATDLFQFLPEAMREVSDQF